MIKWAFIPDLIFVHDRYFIIRSAAGEKMSKLLYEKRKIINPILAFIIPVLIMVSVSMMSGFYPFGRTSILMADMRYQFVDYFGYMKQIFFGDDTYFYSFSKTFGGDLAGLAAYYCNNPFLIFLLFVPNDLLPGGILIMMTVMLGFIGLTFNIFLNEIYGSRYTTLIFSTAYAFMGYLMGYFNCVQYFFNIMMLPLVMLGVYRMIKNERLSILYIISQALSIFSCYYIGYMICIFSVCFFIYCFFTVNTEIKAIKDIKAHINAVYAYILASVIGVGISAVSLLCAVISLRGQSSRKHIPLSLKGNFNISEVFSGLYSTAFHGNVSDGLPLIYSGAVALVFILLFYLGKTAGRREKIISGAVFIFLILGFYIDFLNVFWHGFSYPIGFPYRNSFLFSFWVLFLAYKTFINMRNTCIREVITILCIYVIYSIFMCVILNENAGPREVIITGVYIIITFILIYLYINKKLYGHINIMVLFFILVLIDVSYNAYVSLNAYFPDKENDATITIDAFKDFVDETSYLVGHLEDEDDSLYRIEKLYRRSNNDAMLIGYNGLSHFSSTETEAARRYMGSLGFRDNGNWAFYGEGSSTFADCFMGMKYLLSQYDETPKPYSNVYSYNDKNVFLNPYALPLCFVMDESAGSLDPSQYGKFSYQNALAGSFGYKGDEIYTPVEDVTCTLHNLTEEGSKYTVINKDEEAYIEYSFINSKSEFIYMYFDADDLQDTKIDINGAEKQPYFTSYGWSIRELGFFLPGDEVSVKVFAGQDTISITGYEFYYENKQAIADWYETVVRSECSLEKISSSHLKGSVNADRDGLLTFSFPYEKEWKVFIDGTRVKTKSSAGGLLAADINKGKHEIELSYIPKGFILGLPVSIFFLIFLFLLYIRIKKEGKEQRDI